MTDPEFYAIAEDEVDVSGEALFKTVPTSLAGWRALADFIRRTQGKIPLRNSTGAAAH